MCSYVVTPLLWSLPGSPLPLELCFQGCDEPHLAFLCVHTLGSRQTEFLAYHTYPRSASTVPATWNVPSPPPLPPLGVQNLPIYVPSI